jgi:hypothetical protein
MKARFDDFPSFKLFCGVTLLVLGLAIFDIALLCPKR